jgi:Kef-type K+ transport system membrane component KefB
MGWILTQLEKMFNSNTNRLNMTIAFVFLTVALSMVDFHIGSVHISFSSLLVCMMLGTVFCNICPLSHDLMEKSDKWTSPLLALFFVISGAELELNVFADWAIVVIGIVYIISRCLGKYSGTFFSAKATKCSPEICKYLGVTLFPQAGVALGMCAIVATSAEMGVAGSLVRNITLFAVLIYELVGPVLTRQALKAAGDIKPMPDEVKMRRHTKLEEAKNKSEN